MKVEDDFESLKTPILMNMMFKDPCVKTTKIAKIYSLLILA